jgi:hypothetical protein
MFVVWQLYHHGENIAVNVHIANNSNRTVKKIKVSGKYTSSCYKQNILWHMTEDFYVWME